MTEAGTDASPLVLDATCLSHFARADRLDVRRDLLVGRRCWTTEIVLAELSRGLVDYPMLRHASEQEWLLIAGLDSIAEIRLYNAWRKRVGSTELDQGEASVFAAACYLIEDGLPVSRPGSIQLPGLRRPGGRRSHGRARYDLAGSGGPGWSLP